MPINNQTATTNAQIIYTAVVDVLKNQISSKSTAAVPSWAELSPEARHLLAVKLLTVPNKLS